MEIDQEDSSNVFFGNTSPDLGMFLSFWVEQDLCLSSSDESFQDNLIIDDDDFIMVLNGINLGHVAHGSSLNAIARCSVRTASGETASFNDLASGGFDLLLTFIARIHQINVASVIADS
ncbi:unnamed protein product [Rotaria sp. Silwood1]|nr:unnamed protein product [Rotaria sp. Silwood1]CAF1029945.1 unnamed protein product [Rotaria sp. Silwood1]